MAIKKDANAPRKGMQRDKHPSELGKDEYNVMLNGNFQDEHGNGTIILQNEPSNILCSRFKTGFKVVGFKYDINASRTYFFLTNPETGCSEIGFVNIKYNFSGLEAVEEECGCNTYAIPDTPLEEINQTPVCTYETLISDYCELTEKCEGCLNFDINYPIFESNIHIKEEKTGKNIYWTDNLNPQRYLQLDNLEIYNQNEDDCDSEIIETCLQCDKLRIFKEFKRPCLSPRVIQTGGSLKAGVYEVLITYSDQEGNNVSDYYSLTNPIPIFDQNNNILDQTNLDYLTSLGISVDVLDVDNQYDFFKIAVIYTNGLDNAQTYFQYGIYPAGTTKVTISSLTNSSGDPNRKAITVQEINNRSPRYTKSQGLANSNGYLFHYGVTSHRQYNLQPVVNLLGSAVKWISYMANEDIYENGVFVSNYLGYMRDEVVPLSIRFISDDGYETDLFALIPRPATNSEMHILGSDQFPEDTNTSSVSAYNPDCTENNRYLRWQFQNTAVVQEACEIPIDSTITEQIIEREVELDCVVSDSEGPLVVTEILSSEFAYDSQLDLVNYINNNRQSIIDSTGPNGADIRDILNDPSAYPETCSADFGDSCEAPILVNSEIFAISVDSEEIVQQPKDISDYNPIVAPKNCNIYKTDVNGDNELDTDFISNYMNPSEIVYKRVSNPTNNDCNAALDVSIFTDPQLDNSNFLRYLGQTGGFTSLQTLKNASKTRTFINLQLTGTSGTADVIVNGVSYPATFSTSLSVTASNFVSNHAAAINSAAATTVTSSGNSIIFEKSASINPSVSINNTSGNLDGSVDESLFTNKLHSNAIWFKLDFAENPQMIFEISPNSCQTSEDITSSSLRVGFYQDCTSSDLTSYSRIITDTTSYNDTDKFVILDSSDFPSGVAYISLDSPIRRRILDNSQEVSTLNPPCGCFSVYKRVPEYNRVVTYTGLKFGKRQEYTSNCSFVVADLKGCDPIAFEKGLFSYWESTERYFCNDELYDSSNLIIKPSDIPDEFSDEFEEYYTNGTTSGNYNLVGADFRDQPIRHYKFPDNSVSPFMTDRNENIPSNFSPSHIYPIGFFLSNTVINAFLDIALNNGLLSIEERAKINKYEIFRGDRSVNKSVLSKGLLFDMFRYSDKQGDSVYYPNYPLNSLGFDSLNGLTFPASSNGNYLYTFHSPDNSFYKPTLGRELTLDGYLFGKSASYFDEVRRHTTMVILGVKAYTLATTLAIIEVTFEALLQVTNVAVIASTGSYGLPGGLIIAGAAVLAIGNGILFKVGEYRYRWLDTFRNLGEPHNFAYYSATLGYYNNFLPNTASDSKLRGLSSTNYIKAGRVQVPNEFNGETIDINNFDREDSVFLSFGEPIYKLNYPSVYNNYDNDNNPDSSSRKRYDGVGQSGKILGNAASPYVALKQYLPSQYGSIESITWLHTAYCGDLESNNSCQGIFGGDTYISRFSLKRKLPFFTSTAYGLAPLTPFRYSKYFNINPLFKFGRYYVDYATANEGSTYSFSSFIFPDVKTNYDYMDYIDGNKFYVEPPSKFYLYSYGIPYFLVESEINCNFRYAKREKFENFYPNELDLIEFTQEENISIKQPNTYFYNFVYSKIHNRYPYTTLPFNFSKEVSEKLNDQKNTVIYSLQDSDSISDGWLIYRPLDAYQFPLSNGKLIDLTGIESEQVLGRFENGVTLFGAIDTLRDRLNENTVRLGAGGIFTERSINFNKTDLGYAGTQSKAMVNCEFGHFWVDAKRGKVFQVAPGGKGLDEISVGLEKWFKENLPFKILNQFPEYNIDNPYNGMGITMGWDDRLKRVFVTKKEYIPLVEMDYDEALGFNVDRTPVDFIDNTYFRECSWTVAYSPLTKSWISYYSFLPNYYIGYDNYFQTGINTGQTGLWSHLSFLSSFQVFYGVLYPWMIEYSLPTSLSNSVLDSVEYWMEVKKYYNKYDAADVPNVGFNKAIIYNNHQNSGWINLIPQVKNNLRQQLQYPKFNADSTDILQTEQNNKYSFNYFYNLVKKENSGLPVIINDCTQIEFEVRNELMNYRATTKDRLRGAYFSTRMVQDIHSRYKMLFSYGINKRNFYED